MSSKNEKRKALIILISICVGLLVVGIPLAASTETVGSGGIAPGNMWKLVLGTLLASFGGFGLIGISFVMLRKRASKNLLDPYQAYHTGELSLTRYNRIRLKEKIAIAVMSVLAIAMLFAWFNTFSFIIAAGMILGAAGAVLISRSGKKSFLEFGAVAAIIVGIIAAFTSKIDTSKRYEYFVNGIKVGEGNGAAGNLFSGFLGCAILCFLFILGFAYLITIICTLTTKNPEPKE